MIPKPALTYNFFRRQTANVVQYSICSPLEASSLAFDEARGSSATHPSHLCSPHHPMETRLSLDFRDGLRHCNPTFLLGLRVLQPNTPFPTLLLGLRVLQPKHSFWGLGYRECCTTSVEAHHSNPEQARQILREHSTSLRKMFCPVKLLKKTQKKGAQPASREAIQMPLRISSES